MVTGLEFLRHILPDEGYKCALVLPTRAQHFFTDCESLAAFISTQDALGNTVYHGCASYKTNENRKQENVLAVQAFWIDVDAGEGKPYADAEAAYVALHEFQQRVGFPSATVVGSGGGLHAYWPLVEALDAVAWRTSAEQLRELCRREGFHVDPSRTADCASILRTPGTHNYKRTPPGIVQCATLEGPYELAELPGLQRAGGEFSQARLHVGRDAPVLLAAAANLYGPQDSDPDRIADKCGQLRKFRETAGRIPEPSWHLGVGILAHCGSAHSETAHRWSAGHPTYSREETDSYLARAGAVGPPTCAAFSARDPGPCTGCPFQGKISTPLQLGRGVDEPAGTTQLPASPVRLVNGNIPVDLPAYFDLTDGLHFSQGTPDGKIIRKRVSGAPLWLDSIQTDESTQEAFSLCFKLQLPNAGTRDIAIGAKTMFSSNGIGEMHGRGAVIHDADLFKKYLREAIDGWHKSNRLQMRYDQFGWKQDDTAFLFGGNLYTAAGVVPIHGGELLRERSQYLGPNKGGSLEKWSAAANALFARGCEPQAFALLASFAAPLLRFHSTSEGGAIISLISDRSGSGKTTALEAGASVWGRLKGTQIKDDDTRVSKGLMLGVLGGLPCIYDEIYKRDPAIIREFVMMFTNGSDKRRGTKDGTLQNAKADWQTLMLLASNQSIVDLLTVAENRDAPQFRVMEFTPSLPKGIGREGDALRRALEANSGYAGDAYLRYLVQPGALNYVKRCIPDWTKSMWERTGFADPHRFWIRTLVSVAAAGTIVRHLGILEFSIQRIIDWAIAELSDRIKESGGPRDAATLLSDFFHAHIGETLTVAHSWQSRVPQRPLHSPTKTLSIRYERESARAYVDERALRKWLVAEGANIRPFIKELLERNIVVHQGKRMTLGAGTDYASGQATTVEINMQHPAVSGVVVEIERLIPKGPQNTRAERIEKAIRPH